MIKIKNSLPLTIGIEKTDCVLKVNAQATNTRNNELVFQCEVFLSEESAAAGKAPVTIDPTSPFYEIQKPIQATLMSVIGTYAPTNGPITITNGMGLFSAMSDAYHQIATAKLNEIINAYNVANPNATITLDIQNI